MKYIAYNSAEQIVGQGDLGPESEVVIPDGGYLSVEVVPGCWLTARTSEWGEVTRSKGPMFPDAQPKPPPPQYVYYCRYCGAEKTAERPVHCDRCSWKPMMRLEGPAPAEETR